MGDFHKNLIDDNLHALPARTFADIAARDADTAFQVTTNINKVVRVDSPASYFILLSVGPAVWLEISTLNPIDTFLELLDVLEITYTGFAGTTPIVNPGETGLIFSDLLLAGNKIFSPSSLSLTLEASSTNPVIVNGTQAAGLPSFLNIAKLGTTVGKLGDAGTGGIIGNAPFFQIAINANGDLEIAPRATTSSDLIFRTTNPGFTNIIERMRIKAVTGAIGIGTATPDPAALLDLDSTTLGFYPMRMATTQRDLIPSPPIGLQIDNITTNALERFDGAVWQNMASSGDVFGPGSSTDNAMVVFDGTTGKLVKNSPNIVDPTTGQLLIDSTSTVPLRVRMGAAPGNPSLINIEDTISRAQLGYFGTPGLTDNITQIQIGASLDGGVVIASRGNFAGGGVKFFTPNAALNALVERMQIADDPGTVTIRNGTIVGSGQLTIGTPTPVSGSSLTIENSTALMCGQLIGGAGKWRLETVGGVVRFGSVFPTTTGIMTNNTVRTQWDAFDGRIRILNGIATKKTNIADADYTLLSTDYRIATTSITAPRTYTIPSAEIAKGSATEGREWKFKDQSGDVDGTNTITIVGEGGELFDGETSLVVTTPFHDFSLYADGSNVFVEAA